jgi:hypothetical protein
VKKFKAKLLIKQGLVLLPQIAAAAIRLKASNLYSKNKDYLVSLRLLSTI